MAELEIREVTRDDLPLLRGLYAATKNRLRPEEYDRWRFFDTPWGDSPAMIAVDGDVCAALYIVWPAMLRLGDEDVLGAQSMDTMTHPDYRGRGLFVGLAEECFAVAKSRGIEVVYGFPNASSYPGFVRRLNFDHVGDVVSWRPARRLREPAAAFQVDRVSLDDIEPFLTAWQEERDICRIRRDRTWIDWRYGPASGEMYQWLSVADRGGVRAAALIGERNESWGGYGRAEFRVHEVLADSEASRTAILHAARRHASNGGGTLKLLAHDDRLTAPLSEARYRRDGAHPLIVRKLVSRRFAGNVHHFPYWRIVGGDMDSF